MTSFSTQWPRCVPGRSAPAHLRPSTVPTRHRTSPQPMPTAHNPHSATRPSHPLPPPSYPAGASTVGCGGSTDRAGDGYRSRRASRGGGRLLKPLMAVGGRRSGGRRACDRIVRSSVATRRPTACRVDRRDYRPNSPGACLSALLPRTHAQIPSQRAIARWRSVYPRLTTHAQPPYPLTTDRPSSYPAGASFVGYGTRTSQRLGSWGGVWPSHTDSQLNGPLMAAPGHRSGR